MRTVKTISSTFLWLALWMHVCSLVSYTASIAVPNMKYAQYTRQRTVAQSIDYQTFYYKQPVDHFSFYTPDTFQLRYLYADQYWQRDTGPIFFYTGNEGDITWFCNNTGALWDWAPQFGALLVFAEHRYYGESLPYGNDSFKDAAHVGFLTSEQALADYAQLITHIKSTVPGAVDKPVVAFGGSYGGMLAAWFRIKYPHIVIGALAASAPIWQFGDLVPLGGFYEIVTRDFQIAGANCAENIRRSWDVITNLSQSDDGRIFLHHSFRLCDPLDTKEKALALKGWLSEIYVNLAMVDYPYPASFLAPLPGNPIQEVCKFLADESPSDLQLLLGLGSLLNVYFNYTGNTKCFSPKTGATSDLGDKGWGYQACTEMVMPMETDGIHDMFEPGPWNLTSVIKGCRDTWHVTPRPDWIITQYGGKNITQETNIIFSQGSLDPWSQGGVLESLSPSLVSIIIPDGAHHLDLRAANPEDPASVVEARDQELEIIRGWITGYYNQYAVEATGCLPKHEHSGNASHSSSGLPTGLASVIFVLTSWFKLLSSAISAIW